METELLHRCDAPLGWSEPHPHIGLQTVTWLVAGEALREEATGRYAGELHGHASPARRDTDHLGVDLDLRAGVPFEDELVMWWNYVGRTRAEVAEAHRARSAHEVDRFGEVPSPLPRIDTDPPPWDRPDG